MTEIYLQNIWNTKRFHSPSLALTDGTPVTIIDTGIHNLDRSGPDFEMGRIQIEKVTLIGPIEIHVNASDWYRHNHDSDKAYDNVILHVVNNFDQEIIQNGRILPTIELKSFMKTPRIDPIAKEVKQKDAICQNGLSTIDPIYLESMKSKALIQKLDDKVKRLDDLLSQNPAEVFYFLLMGAFGMKINKSAFEELAIATPYSTIEQLQPTQRMNLMLAKSGLMNSEYAKSKGYIWNRKGTRPANFPWKRLEQCMTLLNTLPLRTISESEYVTSKKCLQEVEKSLQYSLCDFSRSFINHILINVVIPFRFWKARKGGGIADVEVLIDELSFLPPEQNRIIKWWNKIGVVAANAYDSQGLIALNRYYCCRKKCLSCEVGRKLLNR